MPTETDDEPSAGRSGERPGEQLGERAGERIAKLLARAGIASRREVERMIAEGRIALNGTLLDTPATILASLHGITVDGQPVAAPPPARLFLYHKPAGLLVTERDPAGRPTIYDRLPGDLPRVVPVGRLDLATEGLLLLTTDGGLKRQLELPATGVERTYRARAYGDVTQARLEELIDGIEIEGVRYGPIDANMERRTGANGWIEMTLTEGKNREVRRVLEHLGLQVSRLIRTRYGPFVLGDLMPGDVGEARQVDLVGFRRAIEAKRPRTEQRVAVTARAAAAPLPNPTATEPDRSLRRRPAPAAERPAAERPTRSATPRAAKPSSGWGTRARPSRPGSLQSPSRRTREDEVPATDRPSHGRPDRTGARGERTGKPSARDMAAGPRGAGGKREPSAAARSQRNDPTPDRAVRPGRGTGVSGGAAAKAGGGAASRVARDQTNGRSGTQRGGPSVERPRRGGPGGPSDGGTRPGKPPRKPR